MTKRLVVGVLLLFVAGCGGAAPAPAASAPSSATPPPPSDADGAEPKSVAPALPMTTPDSAGAPSAGSAVVGRDADRMHARSDFESAFHQLDASMNECAAACRALASMERATEHLCDIAKHGENDDDQPTCDDARKKLHAARERVKRACTTCPAGPTLDPGAPP